MKYEVFPVIKVLEDHAYKVEIHVNPPPADFLGIGFDLLFKENIGELEFTHYELGPAFSHLSEIKKPVILYKDLSGEGKLVFGLTLKANDLIPLKDSHLITLYFKQAGQRQISNIILGFQHQVISLFQEKRVNLENVHWQTIQFDPISEKISEYDQITSSELPQKEKVSVSQQPEENKQVDESVDLQANSSSSDVVPEMVETSLTKSDLSPENKFSFEPLNPYFILLSLLLIFFVIGLLIKKFIKKKG